MTNLIRSSSWSIRTLLVAAAVLFPAASARRERPRTRTAREKGRGGVARSESRSRQFFVWRESARARDVVDNIDTVLAVVKDPQEIMDVAALIAEFGVLPDVNSLEYWGEDAVTRAHLKPYSSAAVRLFDAAANIWRKKRDAIAGQVQGNNAAANLFAKLDDLHNTAQYTRNMSVYFDCIATRPQIFIDPRTKQELTPAQVRLAKAKKQPLLSLRKSMADETILALREFNDAACNVPPDPPPGKNPGANIQARIRNITGKLHMAAGDYKEAKASFVSVFIELARLPPQAPPPTAIDLYDARYFNVVCDILSGASGRAPWQTKPLSTTGWPSHFPALLTKVMTDDKGVIDKAKVVETNKGVDAAEQMLRWAHQGAGGRPDPGSPGQDGGQRRG